MNSIDTASNNTLLVLSRRQMVMYFYVKWKRIVIICYVTTQCLVLAAVKRQQPLSDTIYSLIILQRGYISFIQYIVWSFIASESIVHIGG